MKGGVRVMDYGKIIEVLELSNYREVNRFIKSGWILLSPPSETYWSYSLGWDKSNGDIPVDPYNSPEYLKEMEENGYI